MPGVLTDSGVIPPAVTSFFDKKLLRRALPKLCFMRVAQRRPLESRNGTTIVFRRFERLSNTAALVPLTEGITPTGQALSKTDITALVIQHGNFIELTDFVRAVVESPLLNEATRLLSEQASQVLDLLMRNEANAGTLVFRGGGVALRTDIANRAQMIDNTILDRVIRDLERSNASYFTSMIDASTKVTTSPIRPAFWGICHPDIHFTLQELPGWVPVEQYAGKAAVMEMEVGAYKNTRWLATTQQGGGTDGGPLPNAGGSISGADVKSTGGTLADVYLSTVFATDAIAAVPLDGMSLQNILKPIGSAGSADPLNQRGTSAWKYTGARKRLNENFLRRIETSAGELEP